MKFAGGSVATLSASLGACVRSLAQIPGRLRTWRARQRVSPAWMAIVAILAAIVALPLATIVTLSLSAPDNAWPHLMRTVLPAALADTALLLLGAGVLCLVFGTGTAWLVTMYRFPGRAVLDRLLVLPLAMPTYIIAYCYVELLDFSGPVQRLLRAMFGWQTARDYWFPEVRTLPGAIVVLAAVLYPYVYLSARASFVQQSVCVLEVARTLGRTSAQTFWAVALPLARPALAAGAALALMECLNDLGAVQYLGVQTLTVSVYTTWLQRSSLGGAAQIALVILLVVLALMLVERAARGGSRFHHTTGRYRSIPFSDLEGWHRHAATAFCCLPVLAGFVVPFAVLLVQAAAHVSDALAIGFWRAVRNSLSVSVVAAAVTVLTGLLLAYARRLVPGTLVRTAVRAASLGYALPGTVLAIGLLIPLAAFDNHVDALARSLLGISTGLLLSGIYIGYVTLRCYINPKLGPALPLEERVGGREKLRLLKNTIDWLSRPASDIPRVFGGRATGVIGASPGRFGTLSAQQAWLPVLRTLGTAPYFGASLMVGGANAVFDDAGGFADASTRDRARDYLAGFARFVEQQLK
jgi:iron(III) transport system permease protein